MGKPKKVRPEEKTIKCEYCDLTFLKKDHLKKHVHRTHMNLESHYCPECPEIKDNFHDFMHHLRSEHKVGHICRVCKQVFPRSSMRQKHEKDSHNYIHGQKPTNPESQQATTSQLQIPSIPIVPSIVTPTINPMMPPIIPMIPGQVYNPYVAPVQIPVTPIIPTPTLIEPPKPVSYSTQPQQRSYNSFEPKLPYASTRDINIPGSITMDDRERSEYYSGKYKENPSYSVLDESSNDPPPSFAPPSFAPPFESERNGSYSQRERSTQDHYRNNSPESALDYEQQQAILDYANYKMQLSQRKDVFDPLPKPYSYSQSSKNRQLEHQEPSSANSYSYVHSSRSSQNFSSHRYNPY